MHNDCSPDPNAMDQVPPVPQTLQSVDEALEKIDRILHQMMLLAELSAGDGSVDRETLQKTLDRLKAKIDRIADTL